MKRRILILQWRARDKTTHLSCESLCLCLCWCCLLAPPPLCWWCLSRTWGDSPSPVCCGGLLCWEWCPPCPSRLLPSCDPWLSALLPCCGPCPSCLLPCCVPWVSALLPCCVPWFSTLLSCCCCWCSAATWAVNRTKGQKFRLTHKWMPLIEKLSGQTSFTFPTQHLIKNVVWEWGRDGQEWDWYWNC